jgi:hypothetical protein
MSAQRTAGVSSHAIFIGNSFTARNDLPGQIAFLAKSRGRSFTSRSVIAGGASLRAHWNTGEAEKAIRAGGFDFVVLQEQSTLPVKNAVRMHENIRLFDDAIRASRAKTVLYMTWARRLTPETQTALTDAYVRIGKELGATVVPVGTAWQRFLATHDQPVLHDRDGSHPTPAGSFLAACVFYATLFGDNPVGIDVDVPGVDEKGRTLLQKVAWQAAKAVTNATKRRS